MSTIHGIWKDGHFVPTGPVDLPDGTEVVLRPVSDIDQAPYGLQGDDPESIARWIAGYKALPRVEMTDSEMAEWKAAREATWAYTIEKMMTFDLILS